MSVAVCTALMLIYMPGILLLSSLHDSVMTTSQLRRGLVQACIVTWFCTGEFWAICIEFSVIRWLCLFEDCYQWLVVCDDTYLSCKTIIVKPLQSIMNNNMILINNLKQTSGISSSKTFIPAKFLIWKAILI